MLTGDSGPCSVPQTCFWRDISHPLPEFIKSAAEEGLEKGQRKAMENHKLSQMIGADKRREEREMGRCTWSDAGFEDKKKLIVGRESAHTVTLSALSDLRGTAYLI